MFDLDPFPRRLVVVGGGYIACEFASIFNGLGAEVTLLHRGEQVLRGFDDDVRAFLAHEMGKAGVDLRAEQRRRSGRAPRRRRCVDAPARRQRARGRRGAATPPAACRTPQGLGLEAAGVEQRANGAIVVDAHYRSRRCPSIYAVGDVSTRMQLTPVALAEAMVLVDHLFGDGRRRRRLRLHPHRRLHPPEHRHRAADARPRRASASASCASSAASSARCATRCAAAPSARLMKLVVDDASDRVVGLHMVGADAGEIVQGFAVAMQAGATKAVFDRTIGIHPTAAEEFVTMREPV